MKTLHRIIFGIYALVALALTALVVTGAVIAVRAQSHAIVRGALIGFAASLLVIAGCGLGAGWVHLRNARTGYELFEGTTGDIGWRSQAFRIGAWRALMLALACMITVAVAGRLGLVD